MRHVFLLGAACWCAAAVAAPAIDLLELPAQKTPQAARSVQVGVAASGSRLISVGERGIVLASDDAGRHWVQAAVPASVTLTAVQWVGETVVWAVGHDGVALRSDDAGRSWQRRLDGQRANRMVGEAAAAALRAARTARAAAGGAAAQALADKALQQAEFADADAQAALAAGPARPLLALHFVSADEGWVAGSYGQLFHTRDAGLHWQSIGMRLGNDEGLHLNALQVQGDVLLVSAESGKLFRSDDRGARWQRLDTGSHGALYGVLDLDTPGVPGARSLLAYGFGGRLFKSGDGGRHWQPLAAADKRPSFVAGMRGTGGAGGEPVLLGQDGSLWRVTEDGAARPVGRVVLPRAAAMARLADGTIAVAGIGGVALMPVASSMPAVSRP